MLKYVVRAYELSYVAVIGLFCAVDARRVHVYTRVYTSISMCTPGSNSAASKPRAETRIILWRVVTTHTAHVYNVKQNQQPYATR